MPIWQQAGRRTLKHAMHASVESAIESANMRFDHIRLNSIESFLPSRFNHMRSLGQFEGTDLQISWWKADSQIKLLQRLRPVFVAIAIC